MSAHDIHDGFRKINAKNMLISTPHLWIGKLNILMISTLPKLVCRFNKIEI